MSGFETYEAKVSDMAILGDEQCRELVAQYHKSHSVELLDRLAGSYLRLVMKIAGEYAGMGVDYDELVALGNVGLLYAIKKYDTESNAKFCVYAGFWIRNKIRKDGLDKRDIVRHPEWNRMKKGGHFISCMSMDEQISADDIRTYGEMIACNQTTDFTEQIEYADMLAYMMRVVEQVLSKVEYDIVISRCNNAKLNSLASKYGCSIERIRQREEEAMMKIKAALYQSGEI